MTLILTSDDIFKCAFFLKISSLVLHTHKILKQAELHWNETDFHLKEQWNFKTAQD